MTTNNCKPRPEAFRTAQALFFLRSSFCACRRPLSGRGLGASRRLGLYQARRCFPDLGNCITRFFGLVKAVLAYVARHTRGHEILDGPTGADTLADVGGGDVYARNGQLANAR